jgi:coenzyme F420-reducing hydrogenase alpha subunit
MGRTITINPVTRIEGHAKVTVELGDDGSVQGALLHVLEFRGFERFVQGMHVEKMPTVTSRICGTCPHAHHLAAAKAVDAVFGIEIPPAAKLLRELLNAGSIIHSHAIHFFALAGPDLIMGLDAAPEKRNLVALLAVAPELGKKALRLRSIGQRIAEEVGGRGTHPVTCVAGGMASGITAETRQLLLSMAEEAVTLTQDVTAAGLDAITKNDSLIRTFHQPVHDMATVNQGALDCYDGALRLNDPEGKTVREFAASDYKDVMVEEALPYSYAKQILLKVNGDGGLPYRVGPLARLNCVDNIGTPLAQAAFETFRGRWGRPCHFTAAQHHARLVEILHHAEKAVAILKNDTIMSSPLRNPVRGTPKRAISHVEAPRGLLIHDFDVDKNANVTAANLLVATQHNIASINQTVKAAAEKFLTASDDSLTNGIEFAIRCWDPCLSCSTHAVGQMPLELNVVHNGTTLRRILR